MIEAVVIDLLSPNGRQPSNVKISKIMCIQDKYVHTTQKQKTQGTGCQLDFWFASVRWQH